MRLVQGWEPAAARGRRGENPARRRILACAVAGTLLAGPVAAALAEEKPVFTLTIREHRFDPARLAIPAGQKVRLVIRNEDPTPEEFESHDLNREKVVTGHGQISVYIGPLKPGTYRYFGEFHEDSAQGAIVAGSDPTETISLGKD